MTEDLSPMLGGNKTQTQPVLCYVSGHYAYFTTCPLDQQWGDDWNDAPYEHNAGRPYEWRNYMLEKYGTPQYAIIELMWDGPFETPADIANGNSRYSVDMINSGAVAWLVPDRYETIKGKPIHAGVTLLEFKRLIREGGGRVFVEETHHD